MARYPAASAPSAAGDRRRRTRRGRRRLPGRSGAQLGRAGAILRFDEPRSIRPWIRLPNATSNRFAASSGLRSRTPTIPTPWRSAILTAFPDRVARRRKDNQLLLASGGSAVLDCEARAEFLVAVDIEDRSEHALAAGAPVLRHRAGMAARSVSRSRQRARWRRVESDRRTRGSGERSTLRESGDRRNAQRCARSGTGRGDCWQSGRWKPESNALSIATNWINSSPALRSRPNIARSRSWISTKPFANSAAA